LGSREYYAKWYPREQAFRKQYFDPIETIFFGQQHERDDNIHAAILATIKKYIVPHLDGWRRRAWFENANLH
jgi:hypothetical protein